MPAFSPAAPVAGSIELRSARLTWEPAPGALSYEVLISNTADGTNAPPIRINGGTVRECELKGLQPDSSYTVLIVVNLRDLTLRYPETTFTTRDPTIDALTRVDKIASRGSPVRALPTVTPPKSTHYSPHSPLALPSERFGRTLDTCGMRATPSPSPARDPPRFRLATQPIQRRSPARPGHTTAPLSVVATPPRRRGFRDDTDDLSSGSDDDDSSAGSPFAVSSPAGVRVAPREAVLAKLLSSFTSSSDDIEESFEDDVADDVDAAVHETVVSVRRQYEASERRFLRESAREHNTDEEEDLDDELAAGLLDVSYLPTHAAESNERLYSSTQDEPENVDNVDTAPSSATVPDAHAALSMSQLQAPSTKTFTPVAAPDPPRTTPQQHASAPMPFTSPFMPSAPLASSPFASPSQPSSLTSSSSPFAPLVSSPPIAASQPKSAFTQQPVAQQPKSAFTQQPVAQQQPFAQQTSPQQPSFAQPKAQQPPVVQQQSPLQTAQQTPLQTPLQTAQQTVQQTIAQPKAQQPLVQAQPKVQQPVAQPKSAPPSSSTPATAPTPAAPTPAATAPPTEPKRVPRGVGSFEAQREGEALSDHYDELEKLMTQIPPNARSDVVRLKMNINKRVSQINASLEKAVEVAVQLSDILGASGALRGYALHTLCGKLVEQAAAENKTRSQFLSIYQAIAAMLIAAKQHDFWPALHAHLARSCPHVVPWRPLPREGESTRDFMLRTGHVLDPNNASGFEDSEKHMERVCGIFALYAAFMQLPTPAVLKHPHNASRAWTWAARYINLAPQSASLDVFGVFLKFLGDDLMRAYGGQAIKMLMCARGPFAEKYAETHATGKSAVVRLQIFIDDMIKHKKVSIALGELDPALFEKALQDQQIIFAKFK